MPERIDHLALVQRFDANEAAFFARELEALKAKTFDIRYPNLRARDFVPVDGSAGAGATSVTYHQMDRVGRAKIVSPNAKDVPRVDVLGKEFNRPVRAWADAYGWTIFEVQSAAMARRNLNGMRASAARRAIEEGLDETAAIGAPAYGIATGLTNDANVAVTAATGAWTGLTADQIIADVSLAVGRIVTASNGIFKANTIVLPDAAHSYIATTPRSTVSDTTILEFILRSFPFITAIEPWYRMTTAGAAGVTRMLTYQRDPDVVFQDITQEFTQLPVQEQGFEFVINAFAQTAGTAVTYPAALDYVDGL